MIKASTISEVSTAEVPSEPVVNRMPSSPNRSMPGLSGREPNTSEWKVIYASNMSESKQRGISTYIDRLIRIHRNDGTSIEGIFIAQHSNQVFIRQEVASIGISLDAIQQISVGPDASGLPRANVSIRKPTNNGQQIATGSTSLRTKEGDTRMMLGPGYVSVADADEGGFGAVLVVERMIKPSIFVGLTGGAQLVNDGKLSILSVRASVRGETRVDELTLIGGLSVGYLGFSADSGPDSSSFLSYSFLGQVNFARFEHVDIGAFIELTPEQEVSADVNGTERTFDAKSFCIVGVALSQPL